MNRSRSPAGSQPPRPGCCCSRAPCPAAGEPHPCRLGPDRTCRTPPAGARSRHISAAARGGRRTRSRSGIRATQGRGGRRRSTSRRPPCARTPPPPAGAGSAGRVRPRAAHRGSLSTARAGRPPPRLRGSWPRLGSSPVPRRRSARSPPRMSRRGASPSRRTDRGCSTGGRSPAGRGCEGSRGARAGRDARAGRRARPGEES